MSDLKQWQPEDDNFWHSRGKAIANRNLWISIPSLLCGFGVWMLWSILTVQMLNVGFPFTTSELFTLTAIAGLTGATLRIPSSFFVRLCGGRYTLFLTTTLLIVPAVFTGFALQDNMTDLDVLQRAGETKADAALQILRTHLMPRLVHDVETLTVGAGVAGRG